MHTPTLLALILAVLCTFMSLAEGASIRDSDHGKPNPPGHDKNPKPPSHKPPPPPPKPKNCSLKPKGVGKDDTDQVLEAVKDCRGKGSTLVFAKGQYNITRKMTWDLDNSNIQLHGYLNFPPNYTYWLDFNSTYRAVIIQNQASWFVVTGHDWTIDAFNEGGIQGNGQVWWDYFTTRTKADGDGRPVSLSVVNATRGTVRNFRILSPPFWSNCVSNSSYITYDGMFVNATNTDPAHFGTNIVPNTDGINTYRSDHITLNNWDVTCGDDAIAVKGNSTNIVADNIKIRGGNGIAFGSIGQYVNLSDIIDNVSISNVQTFRLNSSIQPNMANGIYFKTWTGTVNGVPPTGGGGGGGYVRNVKANNFILDRVSNALHIYQTNGGHSTDLPSTIGFTDLSFSNFRGTCLNSKLVDIECSSVGKCTNLTFHNYNVTPPNGTVAKYECVNVINESGLPANCTPSGL